MLRYILAKTALQQIPSYDEEIKSVTAADDRLLTQYITSDDAAKYLFPDDRVIVDFMPYRLLASNVPFDDTTHGFH